MRRNKLIQEELHQAIRPFTHLIGPNEWLNFSEMVQRIRIAESISESSVKHAVMVISGSDGVIRSEKGKLTISLIYGGYVLDCASSIQ